MRRPRHARAHSYDWRAWEEKLNAYPRFPIEIDGQSVHLVIPSIPRLRLLRPDEGA